jgi:serine/threonine protein kinase
LKILKKIQNRRYLNFCLYSLIEYIPEINKDDIFVEKILNETKDLLKANWIGTDIIIKKYKFKRPIDCKKFSESQSYLNLRLRHPNIVLLLGISNVKLTSYLIYEYVEGITLEQLIQDKILSSDNEKDKIKNIIAFDMIKALAYLQNLKPIATHGDINPNNIIFSVTNKLAKITDYNTNKDYDAKNKRYLVNANVQYCSPKVLINGEYPTTNDDIWSFECTLAYLYCEKNPWHIEDSVTELEGIQSIKDKMLQKLEPDVLKFLENNYLQIINEFVKYENGINIISYEIIKIFKKHVE